jgi:hypothetical protein
MTKQEEIDKLKAKRKVCSLCLDGEGVIEMGEFNVCLNCYEQN